MRIPEMADASADEPGLEPAPQKAVAAAVDDVVAAWLRQRLSWREVPTCGRSAIVAPCRPRLHEIGERATWSPWTLTSADR